MTSGYTRAQIVLHWVVAVLIAAQFLLADGIETAWRSYEDGGPKVATGGAWVHIGIGIAVLLLVAWRLALRSSAGVPAPAVGESALQVLVAKVTHGLLYALMVLMPVSGAVAWFGGIRAAGGLHQISKLLLLVLVALHVLGALYNHFVLKNGLLRRMTAPRP